MEALEEFLQALNLIDVAIVQIGLIKIGYERKELKIEDLSHNFEAVSKTLLELRRIRNKTFNLEEE